MDGHGYIDKWVDGWIESQIDGEREKRVRERYAATGFCWCEEPVSLTRIPVAIIFTNVN